VPLYTFYMPPGWIAAEALHGVLSPSVDRAGRFFFLVAGITGPAPAVWHVAVYRGDVADAVEAATYVALGADSDPAVLAASVAAALPDGLDALPWRAALATPAEALFWAVGDGEPLVVRGASADAALLATLLDVDQCSGDGE
jgi:hypothetical protein